MMNIRSNSSSYTGDEHYNDDDDDDNISHHSNDENIDRGSSNNNNHHPDHQSHRHRRLGSRERISQQLGARRIEFISTAVIGVIFAVSFAHLEYYYIKDPALQMSNGKVQVLDPNFDRSRETEPIIGNMYQYHLFPMLFIFVLISFAALFDDMTFRLFGKSKRKQAFFLGLANLITAIAVEDFAWFVNRWLVPLKDDPKGEQLMQFSDWTSMHLGALDVGGNFVIPYWYLIAIAGATVAYYIAFRKHNTYTN
ncbi:MAG: hypothetical protein M3250_02360 [Thermoproteota archaeon]|nr:hypothetical protein [Thermoproteota archaeon]